MTKPPLYKPMQKLIKPGQILKPIVAEEKVYVVDTSVVIEKLISQFIRQNKVTGKVIVPKAVMAELEHQANTGQEIGFLGLEELYSLQKLSKEGKIELSFVGERPNLYQIAYAIW